MAVPSTHHESNYKFPIEINKVEDVKDSEETVVVLPEISFSTGE
jgi:hypothetical protein